MSVFDSASISEAVNLALAREQLDPQKRGAFVLVATPAGLQGIVMVKISNVWQFQATVRGDFHGSVDGGAQLKASW